ncbi:MAG: class I SAM-dependent methyltransferase [Calditrichaeota bacterium]|nr:MAG: class I SAM-dependent methyltransferase [Calditrichota bacterium]
MKTSSAEDVRKLYEDSADSYDKMMDSEINLPVYEDILTRLAEKISGLQGAVIDTSCGSGHMLYQYHKRYDPMRPLIGIDLSPKMVAISRKKLGKNTKIFAADMRELDDIPAESSAAVISFFALHHLEPKEIGVALKEWCRVLRPKGQLNIATWEGSGPIDYGDESDVVALRYSQQEVTELVEKNGFKIDRLVVKPDAEIPMNAIYLEGTKQ